MIPLLAIAAATIVACEIAIRVPLLRMLHALPGTARKAMTVVRSDRISDHWKEMVLPAYAGRIMRASVGLFLCLIAIALPVILAATLITGSLAEGSLYLLRPLPLLVMFGVGFFWIWIRRRAAPSQSSDYSALDRLFHRIVLGSPVMGEMLCDMDAMVAKTDQVAERPVYVTGLARAGTTVLMRALHGTGQFASLTYADMPMVMAPTLWSRLSRRFAKERVAAERAHGDGVIVDYDAPEALEEVFWRTNCGTDFIRADGLVPHTPDDEVMEAYRSYTGRICALHGRSRYLAKNNNMMLRLEAMRDAIPDATILIVVRDPSAQALSLLSQHRRFADADAFTRSYMTWLVHHEFGPDARPFLLPEHPVASGDLDHVDHWLTLWIACYGWLLDTVRKRPDAYKVVVYERLCGEPSVWKDVALACGIDTDTEANFRPAPAPNPAEGADPALLAEARTIYEAMTALAV